MAVVLILFVSLFLYFYLSINASNKPRSTYRRNRVHKQQIKPISDADVVGADDDDGHIETIQEHEGDEDEYEPHQKPTQPQRRPSPDEYEPHQKPTQPQRRPSPSPQRGFPIPSPVSKPRPLPPTRPPPSQVTDDDDFSPPPVDAAKPPPKGGGIVVERGLPPEEWPKNIPLPMPSPHGGYLNGEYPWIGDAYDRYGSFERLHDHLPEDVRRNIELIAGRGNGIEDLFSDDNPHGCSIM